MLKNRIYYSVKPYLPWRVGMAMKRSIAMRKRRIHATTWPIDESAGTKPPDWKGWPDGKQFAFVLTHDVEGAEGLAKCRKLMELEMEMGFRSCFNFVPEGNYRVPAEFRKELEQNGFEVGVHDLHHDGQLFSDRKNFSKEAERINGYLKEWEAVGFRSGFMFHNLDWQQDLHIQYDSSTFDTDPFEPQPDGVRTIFPFWVPHPKGEDRGYVELPYTLPQDSTLFLLLQEETPEIWIRKLDWIAKKGGMALLNVHPDYLRFEGEPESQRTFSVEHFINFLTQARARYGNAMLNELPKKIAAHVDRKWNMVSQDKKKLKNICVIRHFYYPDDPRVRKQVTSLLRQGHRVDVMCLKREKKQPFCEVIDNLRVFRLPIQHIRGGLVRYIWEYGSSFLLFGILLSWKHLRKRYDVVQVNTMPDFLVFSTLFAKLFGAKVVVDFHEPTPELWITKYGDKHPLFLKLQELVVKWAFRYADSRITVTQALKLRLEERAKRKGTTVCPNVTLASFGAEIKPRSIYSKEQFTLMTHGLVEHRYGHELAIDAVCRLSKSIPGLKYEIVGEGEYRSTLENYVRLKKCSHLVQFHGFIPFEELVNRIRGAKVGIIPMRRSPYSELIDTNKMYEYIMLGIPVVHSRLPAVETAFGIDSMEYFNPDDSHDLERAILNLYQNPLRRSNIAKNAKKLTENIVWERTQNFYLSALLDAPNSMMRG